MYQAFQWRSFQVVRSRGWLAPCRLTRCLHRLPPPSPLQAQAPPVAVASSS
jgi:hypothetical protein